MPNISVNIAPHSQHRDITVISVAGFIDTTTAQEFEKAFQSVLGEKRFNIIIDLKEVTYISSVGWGIFIGEIKRIRNQKGNLFFASMSPIVEEAYDLLQFNTIFKSFPNVEKAVQSGFGRVLTGRASGKTPAMKGSSSARTQPSAEKPLLDKSPEMTRTFQPPQRSHWLARVLLPWKWF